MIDKLVTAAQLPGYFRFLRALKNPERTQRQKLAGILRSLDKTGTAKKYGLSEATTYEEFCQKIPVTDYLFWEQEILAQKNSGEDVMCSETQRFQPTSGSSSAHKWIPYSKSFMSEMDSAVQAWLGDVGLKNPRAFKGSQYWSLSWLPADQRADRPSNDDLELLPAWKRYFLQKVMAVPSSVTYTDTMEQSQFATLAYLVCRQDLSLVSVWSPTFWLTLMDRLPEWQRLLSDTVSEGRWTLPGFKTNLKAPQSQKAVMLLKNYAGAELLEKLWPNLGLVSCWDSAGSQPWAQKIRNLHPHVEVQGKGLWATEGVITIPFHGAFPAAITSHFLEWQDLDTNKVLPTWQLKKGQTVQPMLSGGHGLLRYKLNDSLLVSGHMGQTPTFEFQGRLRETDLVGEKMSPRLALETFAFVGEKTGAELMSMFAVRPQNGKPYYLILARESKVSSEKIASLAEDSLSRVFHYKLARELGQLGPVKIRTEKQPEVFYQEVFERKGMISGNIKVEPLSEVPEEFL